MGWSDKRAPSLAQSALSNQAYKGAYMLGLTRSGVFGFGEWRLACRISA